MNLQDSDFCLGSVKVLPIRTFLVSDHGNKQASCHIIEQLNSLFVRYDSPYEYTMQALNFKTLKMFLVGQLRAGVLHSGPGRSHRREHGHHQDQLRAGRPGGEERSRKGGRKWINHQTLMGLNIIYKKNYNPDVYL